MGANIQLGLAQSNYNIFGSTDILVEKTFGVLAQNQSQTNTAFITSGYRIAADYGLATNIAIGASFFRNRLYSDSGNNFAGRNYGFGIYGTVDLFHNPLSNVYGVAEIGYSGLTLNKWNENWKVRGSGFYQSIGIGDRRNFGRFFVVYAQTSITYFNYSKINIEPITNVDQIEIPAWAKGFVGVDVRLGILFSIPTVTP